MYSIFILTVQKGVNRKEQKVAQEEMEDQQ